MTSKDMISQIIHQMYTENLDEYNYTLRLNRLKQRGRIVSTVLFDLIQTADIDKKAFLFHLLGEIGDRSILNKLREIITHPDEEDETKLLAAVTLSLLDDQFDGWLLESHLADPQGLGKKVIENMLKQVDNPSFIEMFLDNFPRIVREGQLAALEDLSLIKGDKRLINIVGPLISIVDDELKQYIIPILVNSQDRRAFHYLQEIIKKTASKEIQNMARQAIFKLGILIKDDVIKLAPEYKFYQAYTTSCDGSGSGIYILAVIDKEQNVKFIDFVNNDLLGIKDAFGGVLQQQEFDRFVSELKQEGGFITVKVPPAFLLEKVKVAELLTHQAHRTLPVEYLAIRDIFNNFEYDNQEYEKNQQAFAEFRTRVLAQQEQILPYTEDLYLYHEINYSWFIDYDLIIDPLEELVSLQLEVNDPFADETTKEVEKFYQRAAKKLYQDDFLTLLADRLNEYAFLCFMGRKKERAKLAIVAAETLFSYPLHEHPFLREMLRYSFQVHLSNDVNVDEYDDEVDEYDDEFNEYEDKFDEFNEDSDGEIDDKMEDLLKDQEYSNQSDFSLLKPKFPELENLPDLDKLKHLADKMPNSPFAKFFNPKIASLDLKSKILHVNYLESMYNLFINIFAGKLNWESLRKYLNISVPDRFNQLFKDIEDIFLHHMRGHGYKNYPLRIAKRLWSEAIYLTNGNLQPMSKPYSWGAAIELMVGSLIFNRTPMDRLETDYQISAATIRKRMEQLSDILNIKVFSFSIQKQSILRA